MAQLLEEGKSSSASKQNMYGSFVQLPPKIPTNWPPTPNNHRHLPVHSTTPSFFLPSHPTLPSQPTWANEFPNRRAHRRAVSDSSADSTSPDFDGLRHDNLIYMLSDNAPHSSSAETSAETSAASCTPSDHDIITGDKPDQNPPDPPAWSNHDLSEAQSSCNAEQLALPATAATSTPDTDFHSIVDPKRVKRILANRKSAQRSRVRKLQYITELERTVAKLQMEVSTLSPRVAFLDHQRSILTVGNSQLKHQITALAQDNIFRDDRTKWTLNFSGTMSPKQPISHWGGESVPEHKMRPVEIGGASFRARRDPCLLKNTTRAPHRLQSWIRIIPHTFRKQKWSDCASCKWE